MNLELNNGYNVTIVLYDKQCYKGSINSIDEDGISLKLERAWGNICVDYKDIKAIYHEKKAQ